MTDEISIIKAVLDGDIESFRELVQRYEKPVIRMIKNIIDDHHVCEDIALSPGRSLNPCFKRAHDK